MEAREGREREMLRRLVEGQANKYGDMERWYGGARRSMFG